MIISNIYIPINYSNLSKILPEGYEIIYSTLCKARKNIGIKTIKWISHVLITKLGIAYTLPSEVKEIKEIEEDELNFFTWSQIHSDTSVYFKDNEIFINKTRFTLTRDENYESEENFKARAMNFSIFLNEIFNITESNYLKQKDFFEPEIYVPLNYSNLINIIPSGEIIIYSTLCKVSWGTVPGRLLQWTSHVLITSYGIAYFKPTNMWTRGSMELKYSPWYDISKVLYNGFEFKGPMIFKLHRDPTFESKETFNSRKSEFGKNFRKLWLRRKNELKLEKKKRKIEKRQQKKERKEQKKLEKEKKKMEKNDYSINFQLRKG